VAIASYLGDVEMPSLFAPQRDRRAVDPKLERVPAEGAPEKRELRALDETEHHEALHGRVLSVDRLDANEVTGLQVRQRQSSLPRDCRYE
jgi:hypothetical protein